ncbi:hypothetical protein Patl1_31835 [Pistacia atlantica]|uniref:Uncharacterized protein n=1 Tax=Pistacia atlantica TaxID=434234 RepID=A0ACC1AQA6_9ROSI|nr:hypothetical protein Patl1_31835 [Pistacia atlantica]
MRMTNLAPKSDARSPFDLNGTNNFKREKVGSNSDETIIENEDAPTYAPSIPVPNVQENKPQNNDMSHLEVMRRHNFFNAAASSSLEFLRAFKTLHAKLAANLAANPAANLVANLHFLPKRFILQQ